MDGTRDRPSEWTAQKKRSGRTTIEKALIGRRRSLQRQPAAAAAVREYRQELHDPAGQWNRRRANQALPKALPALALADIRRQIELLHLSQRATGPTCGWSAGIPSRRESESSREVEDSRLAR